MFERYFDNYRLPIIAWFTVAACSKALHCITVAYNSTYLKEFLKYMEYDRNFKDIMHVKHSYLSNFTFPKQRRISLP